jgi:hypothetical protein
VLRIEPVSDALLYSSSSLQPSAVRRLKPSAGALLYSSFIRQPSAFNLQKRMNQDRQIHYAFCGSPTADTIIGIEQ